MLGLHGVALRELELFGVQVIPGSHRLGLLSRNGSTLSPEAVQHHCPERAITHLEVEAGEALLLHNWLVHRSDVNQTGSPRRALTACYMDARTRSTLTGDHFPIAFGETRDAETAWPLFQNVRDENRCLRETAAEAVRYAKSLEVELARIRSMASPNGAAADQ